MGNVQTIVLFLAAFLFAMITLTGPDEVAAMQDHIPWPVG